MQCATPKDVRAQSLETESKVRVRCTACRLTLMQCATPKDVRAQSLETESKVRVRCTACNRAILVKNCYVDMRTPL